MNIKEKIQDTIKKALKNLNIKEVDFLVEPPKDKTHGDYASNVAFAVAKLLHKNPNEAAKEIVNLIDKKYIIILVIFLY